MLQTPCTRWWWAACALVWPGLIFATSSTVISTNQLFALVDWALGSELRERFEVLWGIVWFSVVKGWHAAEFAILTAILIAVFNTSWPHRRKRNVLLAAGLAVLFAASDEFHQTFVPTRGGTVMDVLIDSLGVCLVTCMGLRRVHLTIDRP